MKSFLFIVKLASFIFLFSVAIVGTIIILFLSSNFPQSYAKNWLESYFQNTLSINATFQSLRGNIYDSVVIEKLQIFDSQDQDATEILSIQSLDLSFNLLKLLFYEDKLQSVNHINVSGVDYHIIRDLDGKWRHIKLLSKATNPYNFSGNIFIDNFSLHYLDYRGWKKQPLLNPFHSTAEMLSGSLKFNTPDTGILELSGKLTRSQEPFVISGYLWPAQKDYLLHFNTPTLSIKHWISYVISQEGFTDLAGSSSASGYITKKKYATKSKLPFWYDITFDINNTSLTTPYINSLISSANGRLILSQGIFNDTLFRSMKPYLSSSEAKKLAIQFNDNGFTDNKLCLTNHALTGVKSRQLHPKKHIQNHIENTLLNPKLLITFQDIHANLASIPTTFNGTINLNDKWMEFSFASHNSDSSKLATVFPMLDRLSLQNFVDLDLSIFGNLNNPITKGHFQSDSLNCFNQTVTDIAGNFKLYNNLFELKLEKGFLFKSLLAGDLVLDIPHETPFITSNFFLSDLPLTNLSDQTTITGNVDISLSLTGPINHIAGEINILADNTSFFNQSFNSYNGSIFITPQHVSISSGNLFINESLTPLVVDLSFSSDYFELIVTGNDILFLDPISPFSNKTALLSVTAHTTYDLRDKPVQLFFPHTGFIQAHITNPYLNNNRYDLLSSSLNFANKTLSLNHLNLTKDASKLTLSGHLHPNLESSFDLSILDIDTGSIPYITNFMPKQFFPFSATIKESSTQLIFDKKQGLSGKSYLHLDAIDLNTVFLNAIQSSVLFSKDTIIFENLDLFKDDSVLSLDGNFNVNDASLNLTIKPPSKINMSLFRTFYSDIFSVQGEAMISGNINYADNNYLVNGTLSSSSLDINNVPLTKNLASFKLSPDTLTINQLKSNINQGSLSIYGTIDHTNFRDVHYQFNTILDNLPVTHLQQLMHSFPSSLSQQIIANVTDSETLTIMSPYNQTNSIVLLSPFSSQSEYQFIQSIHSQNQTKRKKTNIIPHISNGYLSGNVSITKQPLLFPILAGSLLATNLTTNFFRAKTIDLLFTPDTNLTHFSCHLNNGSINQTSFKESFIKGSISKDYQLSIKDVHFSSPTYQINNFFTGTIQLPYLNSQAPHALDVYLNLSNKNMAIFSLLSNKISALDYQGELLVNISGSLENPLVNTLVNSNHNLLLQVPSLQHTKSYHIKAPAFSITDNIIDFPHLNIKQTDTKDSTSNDIFNTIFDGTISLDSFNLKNLDTIISSVNILISDQSLSLDTALLKGDVSLKNTSLKGTVVTPLNGDNPLNLYDNNNLDLPLLQSNIYLSNAELSIPKTQKPFPIPVFLDFNININNNVIFSGPIFGNSFFGISADLDFDQTTSPLFFRGPLHNLEVSNQLPILTGSLTILNRNFDILAPSKQQLYANEGSILLNGINMANTIDPNGNTLITPLLSLKALYIKENDIIATDNTLLAYTHIVMTIDDTFSSIGNIYFDVFESNTDSPNNISELTFMKQYTISNQNLSDSSAIADSDITELLQLLIPEIYLDDSATGFQTIGETQINTLIRRSILRPLEKNLAKQIGLNDLKINYNLGEKIISGTDSTLGLQFMKHILSDRLVLNLSTQMDLSEDSNTNKTNTMELSEIKLSYYLLKNKNLSVNYSSYKNQLNDDANYLSKFSMRYDYEY